MTLTHLELGSLSPFLFEIIETNWWNVHCKCSTQSHNSHTAEFGGPFAAFFDYPLIRRNLRPQ